MKRREFLKASVGSALMAGFTPWVAQGQSQSAREPIGYLRTNWSRDPFSYGSYSHIPHGASQADHQEIERPVAGTLFFAGEAAHPTGNSTVHAAYLSGQRVAEMLWDAGHRDVIIIGAGMAGLGAAKTLSDWGSKVQVLEARARIGGRVWSNQELGFPVDLGASWIHGTRGNPLTKLARQVGAKTVPSNLGSGVNRGAKGQRLRDRDLPDWFSDITEIQHEYGVEADQLNWEAYNNASYYGGPHVSFPGGYAQLFDALVGDYSIQTSQVVSQVAYDNAAGTSGNDAVEVIANGKSYRAPAVIVTVPLGVLKAGSIAFRPGLPHAKRQAISRLGMGVLDKLFLQYDSVFWDSAEWISTPFNGLAPGQFNQWLNLDRLYGVPVIMAFNAGSTARDLAVLDDGQFVGLASDVLAGAYPG